MTGVVVGADGQPRCPWALSTAEYVAYHDEEWGRPIRTDDGLFERLTLEAFQSGLSWLTILRKRENFRHAFSGFAVSAVAQFGSADRARLLADKGIVRNQAKIDAALSNAKVAADMPDGLASLLWGFAPAQHPVPVTLDDVPAHTAGSKALAAELKRRGFSFVGPTTAYSLMQAAGLVNDHLQDCSARAHSETL